MRPLTRRLAAAALAAVALLAAAALAHGNAVARVTSISPGDGAALAVAPAEVALALSGPPDVARSHVTVRDATGAVVNSDALTRVGYDSLRQPTAPGVPGDFTVCYHVTFVDRGEVTGVVHFSVGTGRAPTGAGDAPHEHGVDPFGAALLLLDGFVLLAAIVVLRLKARPTRD
jgi:methionine-rich copper-binding protein CopC